MERYRNGGWEGTIPIDVVENDTSCILWADLPGVRKEDVNVSINGNQLTLTAEVKQENAVDQGQGKDVILCRVAAHAAEEGIGAGQADFRPLGR